MTIYVRFLPTLKYQTPDHIRITKSLSGETGTVTFTFKNLDFLKDKIENIESIHQLEIYTPKHVYVTKDMRIVWANGRPCILQAVFVMNNRELFTYFFENLQTYAFEKGLAFFQNDDIEKNLGS